MRRADEQPWAPYAPGPGDSDEPWDLRRVVHLHRRAGFGATWAEVQRDLAEGPAAALARLLEGRRTEGVPEGFEETSRLLADSATVADDPARLQAWWLWRMLLTPDPLGERLALCWHNHFATSQAKVMDLAAMRRQNELFRRHARAPFGELLAAVLHDPAMLVWLDAPSNRAEHPNENLARELMELFTLGVGNYGEHDVREAARALTGWRVTADGRFHASPLQHDGGEKTILGRTGRWTGDDLLKLLLAEAATARRLAGRLCELFLRDELRTEALERSLAEALRASGLDVGAGVALVLRSKTFFSDENLGGTVLGPTPYLVGAVRALEGLASPPSTLQLAEWCGRIGQRLFYPPTVFGWDGGRAWITTGSLLGRARFAAELAAGDLSGGASPVDAFAARHGLAGPPEVARFLARLFLGAETAATLPADLKADARGRAMAAARFLSSPEAQLA